MADEDVLLRYQNEQLVGVTILDASTHIPTVQRRINRKRAKSIFGMPILRSGNVLIWMDSI